MKSVITLVAMLLPLMAFSQNAFRATVLDKETGDTLVGVNAVVLGTTNGASTDAQGTLVINNIANGPHTLVFSYLGYENLEIAVIFPQPDTIWLIKLAPQESDIDEIIVEGTRSNKSIANIPTRVEVLTEEIDEASSMDPSKIAHLLTHSTGIQVQQTSATSNTANVRIQGLDGRYAQILKDGFPLYGGFSGSLSIMQIPPLDLRQIEYIKGSASTLYGGGAISGLINLISKEPGTDEILFHINGSHVGAFDLNAFASRKIGKVGFTLLAQRNYHHYFDADKDGFTDLPQLTKYNFNPKLFFYLSDKTRLDIGGTFTTEKRTGGDIEVLDNEIADSTHFYNEQNEVDRITTQMKLEHKISKQHSIALRNSFSIFNRTLSIYPSIADGQYKFGGNQLSSFSELAYTFRHANNVLIVGANFYTDRFKEQVFQDTLNRDEDYQTVGGFANYTFDIGNRVSIESGLRTDYVANQEVYVLPRLSALFKWTTKLTTRIGGGLGYRNASIFNQEAELLGYRNVAAIDRDNTHGERSYGGNVDLGYKTPIGDNFFININQMFFYSYINEPLVLQQSASGLMAFANANGYTQSIGTETFFKFGFYDFVFFAGYTFTKATNHFDGNIGEVTLTPKHSLKGDLLYALPGKWRIGVDYEFKSKQQLSDGTVSPSFFTFGGIVEYTWKQFTFLVNVENFSNVRQTKYGSLRSGPYDTPQFTEVWAPLDGIVVNSGIKIRL